MSIYQVIAGNTALAADLNQYFNVLTGAQDQQIAFGAAAPNAGYGAYLARTLSAVGGSAQELGIAGTLTAGANNDTLVQAYLGASVFAGGTKTGLSAMGLYVNCGAWTQTGDAPANAYGLYISGPGIGSANWLATFIGNSSKTVWQVDLNGKQTGTSFFDSGDVNHGTFTSNTTFTVAHGLGAQPRLVTGYWLQAAGPYQMIEFSSTTGPLGSGTYCTQVDATNFTLYNNWNIDLTTFHYRLCAML